MRAAQAIDLVGELKSKGLVMNNDFTWTYHPGLWINVNETIKKYCEFNFRDPKLATFYSLKWQTKIF